MEVHPSDTLVAGRPKEPAPVADYGSRNCRNCDEYAVKQLGTSSTHKRLPVAMTYSY